LIVVEMKTITAYTGEDFRKWLVKNHKNEKRVGVFLYKRHTGRKAPSHRELMEEAICFGWIDTTVKKLDEERYVRTFARRSEKSKWSENTLRYALELIKRRKMRSEGLKYYKLGLAKPTHDFGIPKNPEMPMELIRALSKSRKISVNFDKLAPSKKKMLYRLILSGKRVETRIKRVKEIVRLVKEGERDFA
jgi:uncharacterized protein YdeI (YjbR/CyaY-like superfamily)